MDDVKSIKGELERKARILRQLEGVYKTSPSIGQRKRVLKEIKEIKRVIKDLQHRHGSKGMKLQNDSRDDQGVARTTSLGRISVKPFRKNSRDREMDTVVSYMNFFENNYLPILSEYYVKLDYSHSGKRDTYYPRFMEIMHLLRQYDYEESAASSSERSRDWASTAKEKSVIQKVRQRYLFALDGFFKDMKKFIRPLIEDGGTGATILLNPNDRISLDDFKENRALNNYTVIEALGEIYAFAEEFIRFLGMPEI